MMNTVNLPIEMIIMEEDMAEIEPEIVTKDGQQDRNHYLYIAVPL